MTSARYPLIGDYGFLSDCHSGALVSRSGSIDWWCVPRFDGGACFGRLLDWDAGGYWSIEPVGPYEVTRRYLDGLVLQTTFATEDGQVKLVDFFSMRRGGKRRPRRDLNRIVEGVRGEVEIKVEIVPRFDYGSVKPWIREKGRGAFSAVGGDDGIIVWSDVDLRMDSGPRLVAGVTVGRGERRHLWIRFRRPELIEDELVEIPGGSGVDERLAETLEWWRRWSAQGNTSGGRGDLVLRSATILKGLQNAPTGAIAAAATTSLPEVPGGSRNWDYRFSWIRDACFTVRSLAAVGFVAEADGFRRFVERTAAGSVEELQILFGMGGKRRIGEELLEQLEGYRGARPVRVGNAAQTQLQLDMYGELATLARFWHERGRSPDDAYWHFVTETVNAAAKRWEEPDQGLWEMRGEPRHFVHSKAMCWATLDAGIRLAEDLGREAPVEYWKQESDRCYRVVQERGFDEKRGTYLQAFDRPELDSAVLLLPTVGFVAWDDERMVSTTDVVRKALDRGGLLLRYEEGADGMEGREGAFLACSFWLVECLARQGRLSEARSVFERTIATANDLGLFSEEWDYQRGEMLGNFPQALTHLSHIAAALALDVVEASGSG